MQLGTDVDNGGVTIRFGSEKIALRGLVIALLEFHATFLCQIRWHQTADYGYTPNHILENVFMAAAFDTYDEQGGVHSR